MADQQNVWGTARNTDELGNPRAPKRTDGQETLANEGVGHQQLHRGRDEHDESMLDKVKEKAPGSHIGTTDEFGNPRAPKQTDDNKTLATGGVGHQQLHCGRDEHDNDMLDKVKEKKPGSHTGTTDEFGNPRAPKQTDDDETLATGGVGHQQLHRGRDEHDKSMMDKVEEKVPGSHTGTTDTGTGYGTGQHTGCGHEKGMMGKMPGSHTSETGGHGTGQQQTGYCGAGQQTGHGREHEDKGMMEKIKEKLPGTGRHQP